MRTRNGQFSRWFPALVCRLPHTTESQRVPKLGVGQTMCLHGVKIIPALQLYQSMGFLVTGRDDRGFFIKCTPGALLWPEYEPSAGVPRPVEYKQIVVFLENP